MVALIRGQHPSALISVTMATERPPTGAESPAPAPGSLFGRLLWLMFDPLRPPMSSTGSVWLTSSRAHAHKQRGGHVADDRRALFRGLTSPWRHAGGRAGRGDNLRASSGTYAVGDYCARAGNIGTSLSPTAIAVRRFSGILEQLNLTYITKWGQTPRRVLAGGARKMLPNLTFQKWKLLRNIWRFFCSTTSENSQ